MTESGAQVEIAAVLPVVQPAWETDRIARTDAALRVGCALDRFGHWLTN
ncbi:MAG: hypothetical protein KGN36_04090 [Acidobacteriota bacterium]|nr:hypothetical protein [Acidobacteriota bacterium]